MKKQLKEALIQVEAISVVFGSMVLGGIVGHFGICSWIAAVLVSINVVIKKVEEYPI
jgi:hypothetical protein